MIQLRQKLEWTVLITFITINLVTILVLVSSFAIQNYDHKGDQNIDLWAYLTQFALSFVVIIAQFACSCFFMKRSYENKETESSKEIFRQLDKYNECKNTYYQASILNLVLGVLSSCILPLGGALSQETLVFALPGEYLLQPLVMMTVFLNQSSARQTAGILLVMVLGDLLLYFMNSISS